MLAGRFTREISLGVRFAHPFGTLEAGLEYGWRWGEAHLGITFQTIDPFNRGDSPLRDDGDAFQAVLLGGGVSLKL